MAYLKINGWEVPAQSCDQADDGSGHDLRAVNGQLLSEVIRERYAWSVKTRRLTAAQRTALRSWLKGNGISWSFDVDAYSDGKGVGLTSGTLTIGATTPTPKFGAGRASASDGNAAYTVPATNAWTIGYWYWTGSVWELHVERSDGDKWIDGVTTTDGFTVFLSSGTLTIEDGTILDDLVWLPVALPDEMILAWPTTHAYGALPYLECEGEFAEGLRVSCQGSGWSDSTVVGQDGGAEIERFFEASFRLREV